MDIELYKRLATSKIKAGKATKVVREAVKDVEYSKQDQYEERGEVFKPVIESQMEVKDVVDRKQVELIKQLREGQDEVEKHVHGEGVFSDIMKNIGSKLFGETMKKTVKTGLQKGAEKAFENAAAKTGDYAAEKAGNKIIEMLSKKKPVYDNSVVRMQRTPTIKRRQNTKTQLSRREINDRVNRILSGGKLHN